MLVEISQTPAYVFNFATGSKMFLQSFEYLWQGQKFVIMVHQWKQLIDSVPGKDQKKSCNYTAKGEKCLLLRSGMLSPCGCRAEFLLAQHCSFVTSKSKSKQV